MYTSEEINEIVESGIRELKLVKDPQELYTPLDYMMSIGGKRLRPRIALTVYNLFKDKIDESILYPAIALEVFHGFTLIHDDIMDKAPLRRGHETVHTKWNNNIAILSGDVMCIKSFEYLVYTPKEKLKCVLDLFTRTAAEVCEGQQYDMNFESGNEISIEDYNRMIGLKTAVLIACSAKLGAIIGGADEQKADTLYKLFYLLGMAFQIKDDYLDTFGDTSTFGKEIGGDIMNNKKTWLLINALNLTKGSEKSELEGLLDNNRLPSAEKIERVTALYIKLGVKERAENAIERYYQEAIDLLSGAGFDDVQMSVLGKIARMLVLRSK